jgi:uncharacterized membrane protein
MSNGFNNQNYCGTSGYSNVNAGFGHSNGFFGGGSIMMIIVFVAIAAVIYYFVKNNGGINLNNSSKKTDLSNYSKSELHEELENRKSSTDLRDEVEDLKRQIRDLKNDRD